MLSNTAFSFATAGPAQTIAFLGSIVAHLGFFTWIVCLVRMRPHAHH